MLTLSQFKVYANLSTPLDANQEVFVSDVLEGVNSQIEREIGTLFNLVTIDESNPDPRFKKRDVPGCNLDILMIGAWQPTGLTVQIGSRFGKNDMSLLVSEVDYNVLPFDNSYLPGYDYPIVGLEFSRVIRDCEIIRLTGTYGFSNGMPWDLEQLIYKIAKTLFLENYLTTENMGQAEITEIKSETLSVKRDQSNTSHSDFSRSMATNILSVPEVRKMINKYKNLLRQSVTIS